MDREESLVRLRRAQASVSPSEAAVILGRSLSSVYALIDRGDLPGVQTSATGRISIPASSVESFIRTGGGALVRG